MTMMAVAETTLHAELDFFEQHRSELLGRARGKYALIKGERLVDVFDSESDAIRRGYHEFGNDAFLVKHIVEVEVPFNFTSYNVGI
jgi:hypothetical protein